MHVLELLQKTKKRIKDPRHWTRDELAVDSENNPVSTHCGDACSWCLMGAMLVELPSGKSLSSCPEYLEARKILLKLMPPGCSSVATFNDSSTHEEVLHLLDMGIAYAKRGA